MLRERGVLSGVNVLVVENEWIIADDFCRVLVSEGAQVIGPAGTLTHALALVNRCRIDAAVLDVHLSDDCDVYPIAEFLRSRNVPFLFATGYDALRIRPDFANLPHLRKPFGPDVISHIVAVVSTASAPRHNRRPHLVTSSHRFKEA